MNLISETKELKLTAKVKEIEIDGNNPFLYDKLSRERHIVSLTKIIESYQNGAVMALNGAWGTGKTTFVKMWEAYLKNNGFNVVYYNAWKDDLSEEPLLSMLRNLKTMTKNCNIENVLKIGAKILTATISGTLSGLSNCFFNEVVGGGVKGGVNQIEKICLDALEKEDGISSLMDKFRESLSKYIDKVSKNGKPLVYFIDELDRCNPHFAVKVLERMKHMFDIRGIVFILAIDKQQLSYSINGYFGSDMINSREYLRRFIDIYYDLPEPATHDYCEYLFDYHGFNNLIQDEECDDGLIDCLFPLEVLIKLNKVTLRQLEKIFLAARLAYLDRDCKSIVFDLDGYERYISSVLFVMAYLKICNPILYSGIKSLKYSLQELCEELENLDVNHKKITDDFNSYTLTMMHILYLYHWDSYCSDYEISGIRYYDKEDYTNKINYCYSTLCSLEYNTFNRKLLTKYKSSFEKVNTGLRFWLDRMDIADVYYLRM